MGIYMSLLTRSSGLNTQILLANVNDLFPVLMWYGYCLHAIPAHSFRQAKKQSHLSSFVFFKAVQQQHIQIISYVEGKL